MDAHDFTHLDHTSCSGLITKVIGASRVWDTLIVATRLNLDHIKVLGDSRIIIDSLDKKGKLQVLTISSFWVILILLLTH
jgi:hypothetical protein